MRRMLTFFAMGFITICTSAQSLIAQIDWTKEDDLSGGYNTKESVSVTSEGLIIECISAENANYWEIHVPILRGYDLEQDGKYKIQFTANSLSAGEFHMQICDWDGIDAIMDFAVNVEAGIKEYTIDLPAFPTLCKYFEIQYLNGSLPSKIIVSNVKVFDCNPPTPYDPANICYIYNSDDKVAEVTSNPINQYEGTVEIPETVIKEGETYTVSKIGDDAFSGCNKLYSVNIPNSVTSIGNNAFFRCIRLNSVDIPNSVTIIGDNAFCKCYCLTSLTIPNSVKSLGEYAFSGCKSLSSVNIPTSLTTISLGAFEYCSGLSSLTIPNNVITIRNGAFSNCPGLTSLTIPQSVTSLENGSFSGCFGLTSIKVEDGNPNYDSRKNCNALIETASNNLMTGCMNTFIPPTVTSIGSYAFSKCRGLTSIIIPANVGYISNSAFSYCTGLKAFVIPNSVTSISSNIFAYCRNLASITIPNSVTSIDGFAFDGCKSLTVVDIPNSVKYIGDAAFQGCNGLTSVNIPNTVTFIGDATFAGCSGLTSINIPNTLSSIKSAVFYHCSGLTSVTIPNSVTSIEDFAFDGCSGLTTITIGNSVWNIGEYAFTGCDNLTDMICMAEAVPSTTYPMMYTENTTLHVPASSLENYKNTYPWSTFKEIVAIDDNIIPETSILITKTEKRQDSFIFDIYGRRLPQPRKGINIIEGKKRIMR